MDIIENLDPESFYSYLKKYGNTICGRHPIGVLLQVNIIHFAIFKVKMLCHDHLCNFVYFFTLKAVASLQRSGYKMSLKFLQYAQSSQCVTMADSSVSYASGALLME